MGRRPGPTQHWPSWAANRCEAWQRQLMRSMPSIAPAPLPLAPRNNRAGPPVQPCTKDDRPPTDHLRMEDVCSQAARVTPPLGIAEAGHGR
eukprot:UN3365